MNSNESIVLFCITFVSKNYVFSRKKRKEKQRTANSSAHVKSSFTEIFSLFKLRPNVFTCEGRQISRDLTAA